jgi:acetyl-CoA carboxylase biotin carboxyl carrier protein
VAEEVRAEMVGNVMKVVAAPGDALAAGDTLVLLESMKMEIPVVTEEAGVVRRITVTEGQVVKQGDRIAELD